MQKMQPHLLEKFLEAKFGQNLANLGKNIPQNIRYPTAMIETYSYHFQCIALFHLMREI